jgi:hypothetical protein
VEVQHVIGTSIQTSLRLNLFILGTLGRQAGPKGGLPGRRRWRRGSPGGGGRHRRHEQGDEEEDDGVTKEEEDGVVPSP